MRSRGFLAPAGLRGTSPAWKAFLAAGLLLAVAALAAFPHRHADPRTERPCVVCHLTRPGGVALPATAAPRLVPPAPVGQVAVDGPVRAPSSRRPADPLLPRSPPPAPPSSAT